MDALLCFCACPDGAAAARIARALVGERLAACASVLPGMWSIYRWRGEVEDAEEVLLLAKTTRAMLPALQARLVALHPYELPELVAVEAAGGLPAYLGWIADNVGAGAPRAHDSGG
jgi:periplasmic divalent cation tolerance protein